VILLTAVAPAVFFTELKKRRFRPGDCARDRDGHLVSHAFSAESGNPKLLSCE
jgi:hypothetical protein